MGFLNQFGAIFVTLLKLKRWRFLWLIIFCISAASNHFLYNVVGLWVTNLGMKNYYSINGDDFAENGIIVGKTELHKDKFKVLTSLINEQRQTSKIKYTIEDCSPSKSSAAPCLMQLLSLMVSQTVNKYFHYIDYSNNKGGQFKIVCSLAYGSEAYCPFITGLATTASYGVDKAPYRFRSISVFRYVPNTKSLPKVKSGSGSMCALDSEYSNVMPRTVIVQSFLLLSSAFIYLIASTVSCIGDLKRGGFLQLLFHRGFSVIAYWLALWIITLFELCLVGVLLAASHYIQCPGFYNLNRLGRLVLVFVTQIGSVASIIFLLTVSIKTQFVIGVATLLLASAFCVALGLSLILLHWLPGLKWTGNYLLALPPGLLGEQLQAVLVSQLYADIETEFHNKALMLSAGLFAATILLTLYLDCVLSSGSGIFVRTPHFPCLMICGRKGERVSDGMQEPPLITVEGVHDLRPVVQIRNLSKTFASCTGQNSVKALSKLSVALYENQLTAFVGHDGSGRSTLSNILAGKLVPSTGETFLSGYSMNDAKTRRNLTPSIGVCYQHDALCGGISVNDSIDLVLSACNVKKENVDEEVNHILTRLNLSEKLNQHVCSLSSGQKRKLCTALALIGNPHLIILDEPTNNLDPVSRRQMWKLLQEYRLGRCIALSTSLMEEADVMADRKIFLAEGSLICAGSSLFLRRAFDCGFIFQTKIKTERHVGWVMRAINRKFPTARARTIYRSELELEVSASEDKLLPGVAEALEKLPDLIEAFGLAQHSLEQIFSRLKSMPRAQIEKLFKSGEIGYTVDDPENAKPQQTPTSLFLSPSSSVGDFRRSPSLGSRVTAMLKLNCSRLKRKRSSIFSRIIFPVLLLFTLIAILIVERHTNSAYMNIWSNLIGSKAENFSKGVCMDDPRDGRKHYHFPEKRMCQELFSMEKDDAQYLFKSKAVTSMQLEEHVSNVVAKDSLFQSLCSRKDEQYVSCPMFYASEWCEDYVANEKRNISLGLYSHYGSFNFKKATTSLIWIYRAVLTRFNRKLAPDVTMDNVYVEGVKDFRTTFIPIFGIFFQIVILCIIPATYLDDLIEDRVCEVKHQIQALGMSTCHYWICIFIIHWMQYSMVYLLSTLFLFVLQPGSYFNTCFFIGVFLPTLFLSLTSNQLCAYFVSTVFEKQSTVLTVVYSIFVVVLGLSLILAQMDNMSSLILICIFPPVASIAMTFYGSKLIIYSLAFMKIDELTELSNPLSILLMSLHLQVAVISMLAHIMLLSLAIFIMERRHVITHCCSKSKSADAAPLSQFCEDLGVQEETDRLDECPRDSQNLLEVRHLRILGNGGEKIARDITFGVRPGEIFGLVGPNGSGKTAVVSAIAGDTTSQGGTSEVLANDMLWLPSQVAASKGKISHCKSTNPLLSHITVEEHLKFYASVMGISGESHKKIVQEFLKAFHLEGEMHKMVFQLSNGCKKRLSIAICLLGDPSIVVIDDPSEGVDPEGRRLIWTAIKSIASNNRAVVVTMHTMEEVEGLCTRVSIMNHGLLVAIGTVDQILNRYGQIYTLSIQLEENLKEIGRIKQAKIDTLLTAVNQKFPDAFVVEQMAASVLICVPVSNIDRLSNVLKWLVDHKKSLGMAIFSLRQVYLDEIFQLIIKNHDDKLLRKRFSIFSMVEALPLDQLSNASKMTNSLSV